MSDFGHDGPAKSLTWKEMADFWQARYLEEQAAAQRVRDVHSPQPHGLEGDLVCHECKKVPDHYGNVYPSPWPCNTMLALDGDRW